jgi:hypothetical protein
MTISKTSPALSSNKQLSGTVDVSTNVYNKVGLERQLAAVQALDNVLHPTTHSA